MGKDAHEVAKRAGSEPIEMAYARTCSNLYHIVDSPDRYLLGAVNVVRRAHGDWLALCKVTELDTMRKLVAFGAGRTYFDALRGLNASISGGKWKDDRPWVGRGK